MTIDQIITVIAIIVSPIIAVIITLWHQSRSEQRDHKFQLFQTLMRRRKDAYSVSQEWVDALNLIDVIFHDNQKAVELWHAYHDKLYQKDRDFAEEGRIYLNLLHELAKDLGYNNIQQTDIDRFYQPIGLGDQTALNEALKKEHLAYLKNSNELVNAQVNPSLTRAEYDSQKD